MLIRIRHAARQLPAWLIFDVGQMKDEMITGGKLVAAVATLSNPVTGLAGAAFFEVLSHYSAKKVASMLNDIEARLRALEATGVLEVNNLVKKEGFLNLLLTACMVAQRTQRKEKISRIKNAVIFCSQHPPTPEEVDSFFHLVDQLTEEHFLVLRVLSDHLAEFSGIESFSEAFAVFSRFCAHLSSDAFGHYLYDLKYRRLVRLSPTIEDDEGLAASTMFSASGGIKGETIIISEIAKQLLLLTQ